MSDDAAYTWVLIGVDGGIPIVGQLRAAAVEDLDIVGTFALGIEPRVDVDDVFTFRSTAN